MEKFNKIKNVVVNSPDFDLKGMQEELEGPAPIRALAALGGVAMCISCGLSLMNVVTMVLHPASYLLHVYLIAFGLSVIAIEAKTLGENAWKEFIYKWLPFTTIVGGKGLMYIFFGLLGLTYSYHDILVFASGAYIIIVGLVYCLIHSSKFQALNDKYAHSQYITRSSMYN